MKTIRQLTKVAVLSVAVLLGSIGSSRAQFEIGDNVLIGAGSVVLSDIPSNEVWVGNPAKFLKKR